MARFHHGRSSVLFFLESTLTLDQDLLSSHVVFLQKLPSLGSQNALPPMRVFHTALLLIKKLPSQHKKGSNAPVSMGLTGLTVFPQGRWLDRQWKGLFKRPSAMPAGQQCLVALRQPPARC